MPLYDFVCDKAKTGECLTKLEDHHLSFEEHDLVTSGKEPMHCPTCGGSMTQLMNQFNFELKGKGWPGKDMVAANEKLINRNKRLLEKPESYREFAKWVCHKSGKGIKKAIGGPDI